LYENTGQIPYNTLHGPMYYTIGVTCVYNGPVFYIFRCNNMTI